MDPLSDMLRGIRADGASATRAALEPGWRIGFPDRAPLTLITLVHGGARLVLADGTEHPLRPGSTALVRDTEPFHLVDRDAPPGATGPAYLVSCFDPDADCEPKRDPHGPTALVVGAYRDLRPRHERLMRTLPKALVLDDDPVDVLWLKVLDDAMARSGGPGGGALVDRVLDWGLVCTLSCWFDLQGAEAPAWYRGVLDPVTGPAIEAMHRDPAARWTVDALAAEARVSRAHFAKRFTAVMGRPPLGYLAEWRMSLAEDLLTDPEIPVSAVARQVGYADPFAFSTAFKRLQGMSPRAFRDAQPA
ncbi:AraC family transcriptional regulator [Glycomyces mayteni]|uniref:AraC family transcriptional regulator n=1 Tax=Glycomyces mayteni TaxID=543887 RepID=A0ABW2D2D4_9ACTN